MRKTMMKMVLAGILAVPTTAVAVDDNTVEIVYNGTTATVAIASNISDYVTVSSGTSSHVKIVQSTSFAGVDKTTDNEDGEIIYSLSGTSADGEFYMEGSYKCIVELNGLTLTNPSGPALNIQNGKRIELSAKKNTVNTIADGANDDYNGCYHGKGHTKFKGKGTLNVVGNSKHAIYSKEYIEVKNLTINVTAAAKDAIHCKEYFLMESGTVNITGATDDGIQVELDGSTSTGKTSGHEDEDSGNFYQEDGTLSISGYGGKAIKADGNIVFSGGKQDFDISDVIDTGIDTELTEDASEIRLFDLYGRQTKAAKSGLYIIKNGPKTRKILVR
jgi:hypothetical protein